MNIAVCDSLVPEYNLKYEIGEVGGTETTYPYHVATENITDTKT